MGQSAGAVDTCLLMASPLSQGLFQGAILESGECQDTPNEDIRRPIHYNLIDTTGEASGERLTSDLGVSSGPGVLQRLRQTPASEILKAWEDDPGLHFVTRLSMAGLICPKQPAQIFAEGKEIRIPILVGSNADEATVFGDNNLKTVDEYKRHLQQDTGEVFRAGAPTLSGELRCRCRHSFSTVGERRICLRGLFDRACDNKAGVKAYLYYFTYVDSGKRSRLRPRSPW